MNLQHVLDGYGNWLIGKATLAVLIFLAIAVWNIRKADRKPMD